MKTNINILPIDNRFLEGQLSPGENNYKEDVSYRETSRAWEYIVKSLRQYKYWIMLLSLISALMAMLAASLMAPIYRGNMTLLIETKSNNFTNIESVYGLDTKRSTFLETQFSLMTSRAIAERAVNFLDLDSFPEFSQKNWNDNYSPDKQSLKSVVLGWIKETAGHQPTAEFNDAEKEVLWRRWQLSAFRDKLRIFPVSNTQLVNISFDSNSPKLSAVAANALGQSYIDEQLLTVRKVTSAARVGLTVRLTELKENLEKAEIQLDIYRENKGLVGSAGGVTDLTETEIQTLADQRLILQLKISNLKTTLDQILAAGNDSYQLMAIPEIRRDLVIQEKSDRVAELQRELKLLDTKYVGLHPDLILLKEQLVDAQREREVELQSTIRSIRNDFSSVQSSIKKLDLELVKAKSRFRGIQVDESKLRGLEHAVTENRTLFDSFFKRLRETDAMDGLEETPIARVIDSAIIPDTPIKPNVLVATVAGALFGILLAVVWIMFKALRLADSFNVDELKALPIKVLGNLPQMPAIKSQMETGARTFTTDFAEQAQVIATDLRLRLETESQKGKLFFVTSAVEGQGKTTVAASLAFAYTHMGFNVLLVDLDMNSQKLSQWMELRSDAPGFTDLIAGRESLEKCIQQRNLSAPHIMGRGAFDTAAIHQSSHNGVLKAQLDELKEMFDMVVIDSSALPVSAYTREFIPYSDALVFVSTPTQKSTDLLRIELDKLNGWVGAEKFIILNGGVVS